MNQQFFQIQWLFNNEVITSGPYRISCLGDVHSLHIPRVTDNDVGRFSVIAENDAGNDIIDFLRHLHTFYTLFLNFLFILMFFS